MNSSFHKDQDVPGWARRADPGSVTNCEGKHLGEQPVVVQGAAIAAEVIHLADGLIQVDH